MRTLSCDFCGAHVRWGTESGGAECGMAQMEMASERSDQRRQLSSRECLIRRSTTGHRHQSPFKMANQQYYGLTVLFLINTINFLDRYSIAAVLTKIKDYYVLTSFQQGLLSTCFLGGYMLTAPVFGYLGDKYSRKWIIVGGIVFWCFATFCGSIISNEHSYLFFIDRILVGVGEASYSTLAPTIIADLFEPNRRKLGLSIFYFAIPFGSGLGFLMGTVALSLGDWRWVFRITPMIGLVATAFLLALKEPVRGQSEGGAIETADHATVFENLRYLASIRSYVWSTVGFTFCLFTTGALSWWSIDFMGVAQGDDYVTTATMIFGAIVFIAGFVGVSSGSAAAQYYRKIDGRADPFVCAAGVAAAIPLTLLGFAFVRISIALSWILLFFAVTSLSTNWAVVSDMVLSVTQPNKRAFATAMQILITHTFGDATSPFIIGFIRDMLEKSVEDKYSAFLYAMLTSLIVLSLGAISFLYSARFYVNDVEACRQSLNAATTPGETMSTDASNLQSFAAIS